MIKCFFNLKISIACLVMLICTGCSKFLEEKADKSMVVPSTLDDLDALLWSSSQVNINFPGLIEMGTDDFYVKSNMFGSLDALSQQVYRWDKEINFDVPNTNMYWTNAYATVLVANTVLDKLKNMRHNNPALATRLEGEALFIRSLVFYYLIQVYAPAYVPGDINDGLGIPLKLSGDINEQVGRSTVAETYDKIIEDLMLAKSKLDGNVEFKTRASKPAANALLSRVFLIMGKYNDALLCAEEALAGYSTLMDYNQIDQGLAKPFAPLNDDVIFFAYTGSAAMIASYTANVDSTLYAMYDTDDLRKEVFFDVSDDNAIEFKGWYSGVNSGAFMGMNTPELHLIMAECYARQGEYHSARNSLILLLKNRYAEGNTDFISIIPDSSLLMCVLEERRKELLFRGVRWSDLKRLNQEKAFKKKLVRVMEFDGKKEVFELQPEDLRYVYPLPETVVDLGQLPQNIR